MSEYFLIWTLHPMYYYYHCFFLLQDLSLVAQADLELLIFLPQSPKCWEYSCVSPCPSGIILNPLQVMFFFLLAVWGLKSRLGWQSNSSARAFVLEV
jgi:hypothetical protein